MTTVDSIQLAFYRRLLCRNFNSRCVYCVDNSGNAWVILNTVIKWNVFEIASNKTSLERFAVIENVQEIYSYNIFLFSKFLLNLFWKLSGVANIIHLQEIVNDMYFHFSVHSNTSKIICLEDFLRSILHLFVIAFSKILCTNWNLLCIIIISK